MAVYEIKMCVCEKCQNSETSVREVSPFTRVEIAPNGIWNYRTIMPNGKWEYRKIDDEHYLCCPICQEKHA